MHTSPSRRLVPTAIACLSLAACGPSKLVNQWSNRDYKSVQLRKVLLIGVSTQAGVRRRYEDEFVAKLEAAGVSAEPSYRYIPEEGPVDEARIADAVKRAQADAVIITRLVRVDKKTEVIPGVYQPAPAFMLGSIRVSRRLARLLRAPRIREYDVFVSETRPYDVARNPTRVDWHGADGHPADIDKEIRRYVDLVVKALSKQQVL